MFRFGRKIFKMLLKGYVRFLNRVPRRTSENPKVLAVRLDHMGDLILSLPALKALVGHYGEGQVFLLAQQGFAPLAEFVPGLKTIPYNGKWSWLQKAKFFAKVWRHGFDVSIDLCHGDTLSAALLCSAWAIPQRVGYNVGEHGFLYTDPLDIENPEGTFEGDVACQAVSALIGPLTYQSLELQSSMFEGLTMPVTLSDQTLNIALCPFVNQLNPLKEWPLERFAKLCDQLSAQWRVQFYVLGSAGDAQRFQRLRSLCQSSLHNLMGKTSVLELASFIKSCDLMITNNTGPMQLSFLVQTPTVVANGPSSLKRWGPRDQKLHRMVSKGLPCSENDCDGKICERNFECIEDIHVFELVQVVNQQIKTLEVKCRKLLQTA